MKHILFVLCLLTMVLFQSSCEHEDDSFADMEEGIYVRGAPSILFSYNVFDINNNTTTSWLIDDEGEVRKLENGFSNVYHDKSMGFRDLINMKSESIKTATSVNKKELVDNQYKLNEIESLNRQNSELKNITTIYGYFYRRINSSTSNGTCSCSSSIPLTDRFEYSLLQQKVEDDITTVTEAAEIIEWIESLNLEAL